MATSETVSGGHDLLAALEARGVSVCFGLPGVHNLPIWAALADSPIRMVGVRHEQAAAYAADGYARAGGGVGVAIVTTGPGRGEHARRRRRGLRLGLADRRDRDRDPDHLAGPGRAPRSAARDERPGGDVRAGRQAGDPGRPARPGRRRRRGGARGRPGVPGGPGLPGGPDRSSLGGRSRHLVRRDAGAGPGENAGEEALAEAVRLLASAERPLLWAGGGAAAAAAEDSIAALAETLGAPVLETYAGRGLVPPDHPCGVGLPPHVPEAGDLWDEADVVLALGSDFDGMMTQNWLMPQPPCLIAVNVDGDAASRAYAPALTLQGDARAIASSLLGRLREAADPRPAPWPGDLEQRRDLARARLAAEDPVSAAFLQSLAAAVPAEVAIVCDMCIPGYWIGGFHPFAAPRRLAYPVGWGTLGFGFPASLGAALADQGPALCVCGDGGFLFACGELATVVQEQLPVCVLLIDDGGYGMLRYDQMIAGDPTSGTDLATPDWPALARSFGLEADVLDDPGAPLAEALERRLAKAEPSMIVLEAQMLPPPTTSPRWYRKVGRPSLAEVPA